MAHSLTKCGMALLELPQFVGIDSRGECVVGHPRSFPFCPARVHGIGEWPTDAGGRNRDGAHLVLLWELPSSPTKRHRILNKPTTSLYSTLTVPSSRRPLG